MFADLNIWSANGERFHPISMFIAHSIQVSNPAAPEQKRTRMMSLPKGFTRICKPLPKSVLHPFNDSIRNENSKDWSHSERSLMERVNQIETEIAMCFFYSNLTWNNMAFYEHELRKIHQFTFRTIRKTSREEGRFWREHWFFCGYILWRFYKFCLRISSKDEHVSYSPMWWGMQRSMNIHRDCYS